ncbi:hypothetical protein AVEN_248429-1 [Araneus ventricosus]|uniref:Uncharacterized protein n=1 Tax=Araneus ventricosus TaxID=182803 RepID=A0A4Y2LMJ3_ARAVE|nr:hypothetical protein AVEN_248429-1 [Araneus ventricosus]
MAGLLPLISPPRELTRTTRPTAFSPLSKQQPAEIRPTIIEVAWPFTAGLGVRVLRNQIFNCKFRREINDEKEARKRRKEKFFSVTDSKKFKKAGRAERRVEQEDDDGRRNSRSIF